MSQDDAKGSGSWFVWVYRNMENTVPGYGKLECTNLFGFSHHCWESLASVILALGALIYAYPRLRLPPACPCGVYQLQDSTFRRILLLVSSLIFGMDLGFKFASRRIIWIGHPYHLATLMQIFILTAPPNRIVTAAFRLHMHMLTGAPVALMFPAVNMELMDFEIGIYFFQNILLLIVPFYLMKLGDPFIPEALWDFSWASIAFAFLFIYHFLPLQLLAVVSQANLEHMLCPVASDSFYVKGYRLFALVYQLILIPSLGKLFVIIARSFRILPCDNLKDKESVGKTLLCESKSICRNECCVTNACCVPETCCVPEACGEKLLGRGDCECRNGNDSGCIGSASSANSGCRWSNSQCFCGNGSRPSYCKSCAHKSCLCSYRDSGRCNNVESIHTLRIVNGELIGDNENDEKCWRKWSVDKSSCAPRNSQNASSSQNNQHRSFLLNDSVESSPELVDDKPLHITDFEK